MSIEQCMPVRILAASGEELSKGSVKIVPTAHTEPGPMWIPMKQSENLMIHGGIECPVDCASVLGNH